MAGEYENYPAYVDVAHPENWLVVGRYTIEEHPNPGGGCPWRWKHTVQVSPPPFEYTVTYYIYEQRQEFHPMQWGSVYYLKASSGPPQYVSNILIPLPANPWHAMTGPPPGIVVTVPEE